MALGILDRSFRRTVRKMIAEQAQGDSSATEDDLLMIFRAFRKALTSIF